MKKWLDTLLGAIYPHKCMVCGDMLPPEATGRICYSCLEGLVFLSGERCRVCGRPGCFRGEVCLECADAEYSFTRNAALMAYDDNARRLIRRYKYGKNPQYGGRIAELMFHNMPALPELINCIDIIAPVPLHSGRLRERGFNQAELIAVRLAELCEKPCEPGILIRTRRTERQSQLSARERRANIQNAFAVSAPEMVRGKNILLVDDVFTTGGTLDNCARPLRESGGGEVRCVTIAVAVGGAAVSNSGTLFEEKPIAP